MVELLVAAIIGIILMVDTIIAVKKNYTNLYGEI